MKKLILVIAIVATNFANAQKDTYLVSGNLYYQFTNNSQSGTSDYRAFGFSPKIGYQFSDHWTAGIMTGLYSQKWEANVNYEDKNNSYNLGGFVRYSKPLNETFSLFADFGLGYSHRKETLKTSEGTNKTNFNGFYSEFQPILFLKVKNNLGLNFGLGGISFNSLTNQTSRNTQTQFNFNFGQAFSIGLQNNF